MKFWSIIDHERGDLTIPPPQTHKIAQIHKFKHAYNFYFKCKNGTGQTFGEILYR